VDCGSSEMIFYRHREDEKSQYGRYMSSLSHEIINWVNDAVIMMR
jgi:hypothetical protein